MDRLDRLDKKILNIVMYNARIASKDIALQCGVSRAAIHQRIQRPDRHEGDCGQRLHCQPHKLGYNTCTYIGVKLEKGSLYREAAKELERKFRRLWNATSPRVPIRCLSRCMPTTTSI